MSASHPSGGRVAAENELLARLGLPPSASAEDVDQLHLAVSQFLAAAPSGIKGWARAQAAALDEAYLTLTDPVGLEGSALRSPTRPPTVVPGGPATPPARRDPVPAVAAAPVAVELADDEAPADAPADEATAAPVADDTDTDDLDALFASVTPGAHRDLTTGGKAKTYPAAAAAAPAPVAATARPKQAGARVATPAPVTAPAPSSGGIWKVLAIISSLGVAAMLLLAVVVFVVNNNSGGNVAGVNPTPSASSAIDMAQVSALMQKITADPKDTASLQQLGDIYYGASDFANAATFYDKVLTVDPKNIKGLLARGAVFYNTGDMVSAKKDWQAVIAIDPKNVEAHYDLGFLAMNQQPADWATVKTEWQLVIALDPGSDVANTVQQHLDALVAASMIPGGSAAPAASGSAAPSGAAPSGATPSSAPPSGAASASPAPSSSAAAVSGVVKEGALNLAFTSNEISAPANTAFTLHFDNQDNGIPHNMLIKDSSGKTVFSGDMVTGPAAVDYQVGALPAGTYTFVCTIHPATMNGTLTVGG